MALLARFVATSGTFQDAARTIPAINNGDSVGGWTDDSGNGHHATENVGINKPTLITNALNGKPIVRFDGTNDRLTLANLLPDLQRNVFTLIVVVRHNNPADLQGEISGGFTGVEGGFVAYNVGVGAEPNITVRGADAIVHIMAGAAPAGYTDGKWRLFTAKSAGGNPADVTWRENSLGVPLAGTWDVDRITFQYIGLVANYSAFDLAEYRLYSTALNDAELWQIENEIGTFWGLYPSFGNLRRFIMAGKVYTKQAGTVWLKIHNTLNPFVWGDRCMRVEDIASNEGGMTVTQQADPRGGITRDGIILGAPAETTTSLVFKRKQADTMKTQIRNCVWDIDMRMNCGGKDRELPNSWEEITRICSGKITTRTMTGTSFSDDDEEQMVTGDVTGFDVVDIYRVSGEEDVAIGSLLTGLIAVKAAQPERCPDGCDSQQDCILYATVEGDDAVPAGPPSVLVNRSGGEPSAWATAFTGAASTDTQDWEAIVAFGDFVCVTNHDGSNVVYTDDGGTNTVTVALASAPAANPQCIDAIHAGFIIVGCDGGDMFVSTDAARTWTQIADAVPGAGNFIGVRIARDNPRVIYAIDHNSADVFKSENGGDTWFIVGTQGGGTSTALHVINQNQILVGTTAGQIYESENGGVTWTEQATVNGFGTKANVDIHGFAECGCGVLYMTAFETAVGSSVYRNVDGGASGRWFEPEHNDSSAVDVVWRSVACCDANRAVAVGGVTQVSESVILLA